MTRDSERAIAAIKPLADELGIKVTADEKRLYCNGQAIGISCNSTSATIDEFIGYLFYKVWLKNRGYKIDGRSSVKIKEAIRDYWITNAESAGMEPGRE